MENGHPDISEANSESTDVDPYENKYYALLRRCENVQQSNERLVHRLCRIKGILRRLRHERRFLMRRLDQHEDNYREVSLVIPLGTDDEVAERNAANSNPEAQPTSNNSSTLSLNAHSAEQDIMRNDALVMNQFNNSSQSASPSWSQNIPSTSTNNSLPSTTPASTPGPTVPTSKRKRNEKSSSKSSNKKSVTSATVAAAATANSSTAPGMFLKNALADYGQLTKLNSESAEMISKS